MSYSYLGYLCLREEKDVNRIVKMSYGYLGYLCLREEKDENRIVKMSLHPSPLSGIGNLGNVSSF
jgi:hypothetical protein